MTAKERAAAAYRKIAEGYIELADINSEAAHGVADDLPPLLREPDDAAGRGDRASRAGTAGQPEHVPAQHHEPIRGRQVRITASSRPTSGAVGQEEGRPQLVPITPKNAATYLQVKAAA